ncbi:hypothetical protein J9253_04750 [Thiothrix litoralis]|uniref:Uncharacterized protein n=1 Tax=Thiothrix litoralis TaxID=2891210 RepID=A0ABX7WW46_9GAMM|nr:hypothetical protein [Thiothrix litoralis]QTR47252.1 hypothetical protein J9253_04750 [Thiothrix litoralis]
MNNQGGEAIVLAFLEEPERAAAASTLECSFDSIKVKKKVALEQMDEAIRQRGATTGITNRV